MKPNFKGAINQKKRREKEKKRVYRDPFRGKKRKTSKKRGSQEGVAADLRAS